jgi:hypothetical protein
MRSVALTDDGEMLPGVARRLLQLEEPVRHWPAAPRPSGTVRLGVVEEVAGGSLVQLIRLVVGIALARGDSGFLRHTQGCGWMRVDSIHLPLALPAFAIGGRCVATSRYRWRFIQCFIHCESAAVI